MRRFRTVRNARTPSIRAPSDSPMAEEIQRRKMGNPTAGVRPPQGTLPTEQHPTPPKGGCETGPLENNYPIFSCLLAPIAL